jgi:putative intracellular protease/amidase
MAGSEPSVLGEPTSPSEPARQTTYGVLVFDGAEELDFVGPWEVLAASSMLHDHADTVVLIAERTRPVRCAEGLRVLPDHTLDDHPQRDVLLVPGGWGHSSTR